MEGEEKMNDRVLLWLLAVVLLVTAGCPPRHPPHTPQPFGMKDANSDLAVSKSDE